MQLNRNWKNALIITGLKPKKDGLLSHNWELLKLEIGTSFEEI